MNLGVFGFGIGRIYDMKDKAFTGRIVAFNLYV